VEGSVVGAIDTSKADVQAGISKDVDDVRGRVPPWVSATGAEERNLRGSVGAAAETQAQQDAADVAANRSVATSLEESGADLRGRMSQVGLRSV
jgi:hypothetical protein